MVPAMMPFSELFKFGKIDHAFMSIDGALVSFYHKDHLYEYGRKVFSDTDVYPKTEWHREFVIDPWLNSAGLYKLVTNVNWATSDENEIMYRNDLINNHMAKTVLFEKLKNCGLYQLHDIFHNGSENVEVTACKTLGTVNVLVNKRLVMTIVDCSQDSWVGFKIYEVLKDQYLIHLSKQRVTWLRFIQHAKIIPKSTGTVFKFPNGLSVKFDDGESSIADGGRIYCETMWQGEIERFDTEESFLVWLVKFF